MAGTERRRARFIYITDGQARDPWQDGNDAKDARFGWRVIAGNNRPLGRSWTAFDSFPACIESARRLHRDVALVSTSVLFESRRGHWYWTASLDDEPVAACVHEYKRRIECTRALEQFLQAVAYGEPAVDQVHNFGPRALRAHAATQRPDNPRPLDIRTSFGAGPHAASA